MDRRTVFKVLLAGIGFYIGAWVGVNFTITSDGIAVIWPPNAIVLTAFIALPVRSWPLLSIVILVAEVAADYPVFPVPMALAFGVVNVAEACLSAVLIRRFIGPDLNFETLRSTLLFFLFAPVLASSLAALGGASVYILADSENTSFFVTWRLWWFGDAVGLAVLTPLFICIGRQFSAYGWRGLIARDRRFVLELILLWAGLVTVGALSLMGKQLEGLSYYITPILLLPFAVLAAVRFNTLVTSLTTVIIAAFSVSYLLIGNDLHPGLAPEISVWQLQEYVFIICLIALGLSSLMRQFEQQRGLIRLQSRAMVSGNDAITISDAEKEDMPLVWVNPRFRDLFGYRDDEIIGRNCRFLQGGADNTAARAVIRQALELGESCRVLLENFRKDGQRLWVELSLSAVRDEDGRVTHFLGIQHDVTDKKHNEERLAAAEAELRKQNAELEIRVRERTESLESANKELCKLNTRLKELASTDYLTGIANRRHFFEVGTRQLKRHKQKRGDVWLVALDIDHFKQINDQFGHDGGDTILCEVIEAVKQVIRPADLFGRVGGEEFSILVSDASEANADEIAERIRKVVDELVIQHGRNTIKVTLSVGVTLWDRNADLQTLAQQADEALYDAKRSGRNCVRVYAKDT